MIGRVLDALRRRGGGSADQPLRPNELRLETVRAERLRREATRTRGGALPARGSPEEQPEPVAPAVGTRREERQDHRSPLAALTTRSGLRQAWLAAEILGPPLALRGPDANVPRRGGTR